MKYEVNIEVLNEGVKERHIFKDYDTAIEVCYSVFFSLWDSPIDVEKELDCENFEIKIVKMTDEYLPLEIYKFYTGQNFKNKYDQIQTPNNPRDRKDKGGDG